MTTWILVLKLVLYQGVAISAVPGFESQIGCQRAGEMSGYQFVCLPQEKTKKEASK